MVPVKSMFIFILLFLGLIFELEDIIFGLEDWPHCDYIEKYCLYPDTKTSADSFFINFRVEDLGFLGKFRCEDRRLCSIKPYIL